MRRLEASPPAVLREVGFPVARADVGQHYFSRSRRGPLLYQHKGEDCAEDDGLCDQIKLGKEVKQGLHGDMNHRETPST